MHPGGVCCSCDGDHHHHRVLLLGFSAALFVQTPSKSHSANPKLRFQCVVHPLRVLPAPRVPGMLRVLSQIWGQCCNTQAGKLEGCSTRFGHPPLWFFFCTPGHKRHLCCFPKGKAQFGGTFQHLRCTCTILQPCCHFHDSPAHITVLVRKSLCHQQSQEQFTPIQEELVVVTTPKSC